MVAKADVVQAFRLLLGREPENEAVVENFVAMADTLADLRRIFLLSPEFSQSFNTLSESAGLKPLEWDSIAVDVEVTPDQLQTMLRHVEQSWEKLGNTELYWSVLTSDEFRTANVEANLDAFYESGRVPVNSFLKAARRCGVALGKDWTCLEYGCGAGRITTWLAEHFRQVIACDISQPHLDAAKSALDKRGRTNVDLVRTNTVGVLEELANFDVFFSVIVLQHNPPPVAAHILRTVLGKLNPGGLAYFQIPTHSVGYSFSVETYLEYAANHQEMEMHAIPQKDLFALVAEAGCELLEIREDNWTGSPQILSNSILLRKLART